MTAPLSALPGYRPGSSSWPVYSSDDVAFLASGPRYARLRCLVCGTEYLRCYGVRGRPLEYCSRGCRLLASALNEADRVVGEVSIRIESNAGDIGREKADELLLALKHRAAQILSHRALQSATGRKGARACARKKAARKAAQGERSRDC